MFVSNKYAWLMGSALLLAVSFFAAWFSMPWLLFIPAGVVSILFFIRFPDLLFYVLIASIPWSYSYAVGNSLTTDMPDEPLMALASLVTIVILIWNRKKIKRAGAIHTIIFILLLQMAWLVITVAFSTYPLLSIKYLLAKCWYVLPFVALPLVLPMKEQLIKRVAIVLFASMSLACCLALYHQARAGFLFAKVSFVLEPFFRNHVEYSALLVCMIPLAIAFLQGTKNKGIRLLIFTLLFILIAATYLSYARGAWLALLTGLLAYWLVKKRWLFKSYLLFIFICVASFFWLQHKDKYLAFAPDHNTTIFHTNFSEHLAATYSLKDMSAVERFYRWVAGVRMVKDGWLKGFGPTTFYQNYKPYAIPLYKTWVSNNTEHSTVHNYFLLLLVEQGILGLIIFLVLVGAMLWYTQKIYITTQSRFWKIAIAAVGAILFMQITLNFLSDLIENDKVGSVFYLCMAVVVMASRELKLPDH